MPAASTGAAASAPRTKVASNSFLIGPPLFEISLGQFLTRSHSGVRDISVTRRKNRRGPLPLYLPRRWCLARHRWITRRLVGMVNPHGKSLVSPIRLAFLGLLPG